MSHLRPRRSRRIINLLAFIAIPMCVWPMVTHGQAEESAPATMQPVENVAGPVATSTDATDTNQAVKDPKSYGFKVLAPALVAIILAIITRQVVPSLLLGVLTGAFMMLPCLPRGDPRAGEHTVVGGVRLAIEDYIIGSIHELPRGESTVNAQESSFGHIKVMIFTLVIGFTVGVIGRNGGTAGLVGLVAGKTGSRRGGALTAWAAGLIVFFDDYANTMIIGPTMRSIFDRLKISRAKLAYIIDSTAAPVASIALIGTWVGAEIGFISDGLNTIKGPTPAFLLDDSGNVVSGMSVFISSLAYRFYPILALVLVFLIALTERDFGPMRKAEVSALLDEEEKPYEAPERSGLEKKPEPRWWLGLFPILILVGTTIVVLIQTGLPGAADELAKNPDYVWWRKASLIIGAADPYLCIYYGAMFSAVGAVVLTVFARSCPTREAVDAGLDGMSRMFPAVVILILAWSLSQVEKDLMLGQIVSDYLVAREFPIEWMPLAIFTAAAGISFATGTSWTTMGILCPLVVGLMASMCAAQDVDHARQLFHAAVGSVLAGSIFGDHCSPISDTTVLSSIAAGCRHESHVWTQIPYALVTALVAMGVGDVLCSVFGQRWYVGIGAGVVILIGVLFVFGRRARIEMPSLERA